jgi:hypothetical protein
MKPTRPKAVPQGLPDAEQIGRLMACPGSWALESQTKPVPLSAETEQERAIRGFLADAPVRELTYEETQLAYRARQAAFDTWDLWIKGTRQQAGESELLYREKQIYLNLRTGAPIVSGTVQLCFRSKCRKRVLIIDYELRPNREKIPPKEDWKLRTLALLVCEAQRVHPGLISVATVYPLIKGSRPQFYTYDSLSLFHHRQELFSAVFAASLPDALRIPQPAVCCDCRGRRVCKEAKEAKIR